MFQPDPIAPTCQVLPDECRATATFVIEYADGDQHTRACDAHFGLAYRRAAQRNDRAFLPIYVGALLETVPA